MNVKRQKIWQNNASSSLGPSLMDAFTGLYYTISYNEEFNIGRSTTCSIMIRRSFVSRNHCIIRYENNQFVAYDNDTHSGTFINCKKMPSGKINFVVLKHGDLISIGSTKYMKIIFKFILPSNTVKLPRLDTNYAADIFTLIAEYGNFIKEISSELLNLKLVSNNIPQDIQQVLSEFQQHTQELSKNISEYCSIMSNQDLIESFKTQVYALLEDFFQCSICKEVMIKASMAFCNHAFCESCISQWLKESKNCPVCRISIQTTIRCLTIDSFIIDLRDLMEAKEKDIQLKRTLVLQPRDKNRGRKRRYTRTNQYHATRSFHIGL